MKNNLLNFSHLNKKLSKSVSIDNYFNIYYRGDINTKNIMILTRIIQEQNNKYSDKSLNTLSKYPIKLHISSYGGNCEMGLLAYDIIKKSRFPIHTYCEGYVCSAGTFLYLAGNRRFIYPNSKILIHQLSSWCNGTFMNMEDQMYNNKLIMDDIKKLYLNETKLSENKLDDLLRKDIYLTSKECLDMGFAHQIL